MSDDRDEPITRDTWNPRAVEAALDTERLVKGDEFKAKEVARKAILDNSALIVSQLIHTAIHSENERLRAQVGMYLTDHVFGKSGGVPIDAQAEVAQLNALFEAVTPEPANVGATTKDSTKDPDDVEDVEDED